MSGFTVGGTHVVPITFTTARRDEHGMEQALNALSKLQDIADKVFENIKERVETERGRMDAITDKMEELQGQVEEITGRTKATTVFSSFKYPGAKEWRPTKMILYDPETAHKPRSKRIREQRVFRRDGMMQEDAFAVPSRARDPTEQYELRLFLPLQKVKRGTHGLGRLPKSLDTASSLLLFNTNENPYKEYGIFDPLGQEGKKKERETNARNALCAAPFTFGGGDGFEKGGDGEHYIFIPGPVEVPDWDEMPENLPGLIDVAECDWDEEAFEDMKPIAPSARDWDDATTVRGSRAPTETYKEKKERRAAAHAGGGAAAGAGPPPPPGGA
eukprot:gene20842-32143_t